MAPVGARRPSERWSSFPPPGQTVNVLDSNLTTLNAYPASQGELVARDLDRGNRDWVDDAVPDGARVAIVPGVVGNFTETRLAVVGRGVLEQVGRALV